MLFKEEEISIKVRNFEKIKILNAINQLEIFLMLWSLDKRKEEKEKNVNYSRKMKKFHCGFKNFPTRVEAASEWGKWDKADTWERQYTQRILCDNDAKLLINKYKFMIMHEKFTRFMCTSHSDSYFFGENEFIWACVCLACGVCARCKLV